MLEMKIYNDQTDVNKLSITDCQEGDVTTSLVDDLKAFCKEGSYACIAGPQIGVNKRFFILEKYGAYIINKK